MDNTLLSKVSCSLPTQWTPSMLGTLLPCYPEGCAAPGQVPCQCNTRGALSKLKSTPPRSKINVTSKSPVGDISVVTLIRTDTTLDHSQKAEKVCFHVSAVLGPSTPSGKEVSWLRPGSMMKFGLDRPGARRATPQLSLLFQPDGCRASASLVS